MILSALRLACAAAVFAADGRLPLEDISRRFSALSARPGWQEETVYSYPGADGAIRSWKTARKGPAIWLIAGIHGEEPAGPNAIAQDLKAIFELEEAGIPVVVMPLCNPKGYRRGWRYPNTSERDFRKGGYSVGDAEHLLPELKTGLGARAAKAPGPETAALTAHALKLARTHPPVLVVDLHEDELSKDGGYIYSQGLKPKDSPAGARIIALLKASGIPIRLSGRTRFGEEVVGGVIDHDDAGLPIRDGSIDELAAATLIFKDGKPAAGPGARTVIVVETPAFAGSQLALRIAAQRAVVEHLKELWGLASRP